MAYAATLEALADPTRRTLFERLRRRPHTVGELADFAHIRQPTVSQHLRVLRDAKLVSSRSEGTRRYYRIQSDGLVALRKYVESFWDDVLLAYAADDPNPPRPRKRAGRRTARSRGHPS
jgi:DNA-binding transcriptional ArsR family regulator